MASADPARQRHAGPRMRKRRIRVAEESQGAGQDPFRACLQQPGVNTSRLREDAAAAPARLLATALGQSELRELEPRLDEQALRANATQETRSTPEVLLRRIQV